MNETGDDGDWEARRPGLKERGDDGDYGNPGITVESTRTELGHGS